MPRGGHDYITFDALHLKWLQGYRDKINAKRDRLNPYQAEFITKMWETIEVADQYDLPLMITARQWQLIKDIAE